MKLTMFAVLAAAASLADNAFAQLPQSRVLTMEVAHAMVQEAVAACKANGYNVTALVVDGLNQPKALLRADGATAATAEVAKMKATAALLYNRNSGPAQPLPAGTTAPLATLPGTINARERRQSRWAMSPSAQLQ